MVASLFFTIHTLILCRVWYLGSSGIVMIYTANNWFTLNLDSTGQSVTFQTGSAATCYDFDVDHEGITLVFNVAENQQ